MEIRQIRSFIHLARTLNFRKAAEIVHLSQPALSLQIRALEESIGVRLLERNRRHTSLTDAGAVFLVEAEAVLAQVNQAVAKTRLTAGGKLGNLRVGFISTAGREVVPELIRNFRKTNPNVEFSVLNVLTNDQLPMILNGDLDIGFLRLPINARPDLLIQTVHREPFVLVMPSTHRLSKKESVSLEDLADENFVIYDRAFAPGFYDQIMGMLGQAGIIPRISQSAGQMSALISMVDAGLGISILPLSAAKQSSDTICHSSIADQIPLSEIGMVIRKESTPLINRFWKFALTRKQPIPS